MSKSMFSLSLAALLACAFAAGAQETDPADTGAPAEAAEAPAANPATGPATGPVEGLDTGRDVTGTDGAYVSETHGDWSLRCFPNEGGADLCQMYQLLTESEGNPVAEVSLYRIEGTPNVAAGATIAVPLGTLLTREMKLSVDAGKAKSYAFSYCTMAGCFARIGLTDAEVEAMKRGVTATIEIVPAQAPDQIVRIEASLLGFTKAFEGTSAIGN